MDYNSQRSLLMLPEYGRHIQKMVDFIKTIEDRDERNKAANTIISIMGNLNPHLRDVPDFKHKLWDHLAIMSDFDLDVDSPYPRPSRETISEKPTRLAYSKDDLKYKHYGRFTVEFVKKATEIEDAEIKNGVVEILANHMKKSYIAWNRDSVSDEVIFHDLEEMSGRKIKVGDIKLAEVRDLMPRKQFKTKYQKKGSGHNPSYSQGHS